MTVWRGGEAVESTDWERGWRGGLRRSNRVLTVVRGGEVADENNGRKGKMKMMGGE